MMKFASIRKIASVLLVLGVLVFTSACGGGGSGETSGPELKKGRFIDEPVANLIYEVNGEIRRTDERGFFQYHEGDLLSFYVGDIYLGSAPGARVITPVELVPAAKDETHATVLNIARFLQTINANDFNTTFEEIILISDEMHDVAGGKVIDFEQTLEAFAGDEAVLSVVEQLTVLTPGGNQALIDSGLAQQNLKTNLLRSRSGSYNGRLSGDVSATFGIQLYAGSGVDAVGTVAGFLCDTEQQITYTVSGEFTSDGTIVFSTEQGADSLQLTGNLLVKGMMQGDWSQGETAGAFAAERGVLDLSMAWCQQKLANNQLTLSGPDTWFVGNTFVPFHDGTSYLNTTLILWQTNSILGGLGELSIEGNLTNYNGHYSGSVHFSSHVNMDWYLNCDDVLTEAQWALCQRITLDEQAQTLTFDAVDLPVCESDPFISWCDPNEATAPLRVDGVLSYTIEAPNQ